MARVAIGAEEKKKLYVLGGLLGAIIVVVFVLYRPSGSSSTTDEAPVTKTAAKDATKAGAPADSPPGAGGTAAAGAAAGGTGGSGAGGAITAASLVSVSEFRNDPFEPFAKPIPTPTPPPLPPRVPPGPVPIDPPSIDIVQPGGGSFGGGYGGGGSLPPFGVGTSTSAPGIVLRDMPPITIPRVAIAPTAPNNFLPPGSGSAGGTSRSTNKRLSGVIIGDSVRAILEIQSGDAQTPPVTRIVQPGDEVDGIRILRIERTTEGGRSVTRMFIRENGEERYVDLRPAPQATGGVGGIPGVGAPAGPARAPF